MALAALKHDAAYEASTFGIAALKGWLQGNWGLLFSHPDDFASYGFEADRWLVHVEHALADNFVRPIALTMGTSDTWRSWVAEVGGATLSLREADLQRVICLQEGERSLLRAIAGTTERFVMFIDDSLELKSTFFYSPGDRLPSPIELTSMAARMRGVPEEVAVADEYSSPRRSRARGQLALVRKWDAEGVWA